MKKLIAILLVALMCIGLLGGCGSKSDKDTTASDSSANSSAETSSDGTFTFKQGFDLDYPPYSHLDDNGQVSGFDVELCQAVCDYLGWKYEAVPFNWDAKDAELNSGACDCIWSGFTVEGREDDYCWSITYSNNSQVILTSNKSNIKTLADLAGKNVGVQIGTSALELLEDTEDGGRADLAATFGSLLQYETYTIAFNDLEAGAIDAIAIDLPVANYFMNESSGYSILDETLGTEHYAIGFRLGDESLRDQVNAALEALVANGKYDEIGQKYPDIYDQLCLGK